MTILNAPQTKYLVEITAYDPALGSTRTLRYASGNGFTTKPSETPASTFYDGRLSQPADISRSIFSGGTTQGRSTVALGDLILSNPDGELDVLTNYQFDGRAVTVYRSDVLNPSFPSDFTSMRFTMATNPVFTDRTVTIALRDRLAELTTLFQTTKYAGTNALPNGLEGVASDLKGKPKPALLGGSCLNLPAPCVNTSKLIYQVSDGAINSVDAVYDRGISLTVGLTFTLYGFASSGTYSNVTYGNGLFVAVAITSSNAVRTSSDGQTWTSRTTAATSARNAVGYGNGLYLIGGDTGNLETSPDGTTWTARTSSFGGSGVIRGIDYGSGVYVAVGSNLGGGVTGIASSPNGTTWTQRTHSLSQPQAVCYGNGLFVAVGVSGECATSPDGTTWTAQTTGVTATLRAVYYGGGMYVAVGNSGTLITSPDGITWTSRNSGTTLDLYCGVYTGSVHVVGAASSYASVRTSPDGITWTASNSNINATGIAFGGGNRVVCAGNTAAYTSSAAADTYATQADLLDDSLAPAPGTFKVYLAGGYFRLGSRPAGLVTCDATQGANAAARTHAQLWGNVLTRNGKIGGTDYSTADITALDAANSAVAGMWIGPDDTPTYLDLLDLIAQSVGAWWGPDSSGVYRIKQFTAPSGSAVVVFVASDLLKPLTQLPTNDPGEGLPVYRCTVRWGKVYAVQDSDLAAGVTDARRAVVRQQWRDETDSDASILTSNLLAPETIEESLFTAQADAATEATRRLTLRKVSRARYEALVQLTTETTAVDIGNVVGIAHPRFGLGVTFSPPVIDPSVASLMRVLDVEPDAKSKQVRLTLWGHAQYANVIGDDLSYLVGDDGSYVISADAA